jgi:hypothetical protein
LLESAYLLEGIGRPDRDEQFEHISKTTDTFIEMGQLVISVDAKKELVGNFKNNGREYHPKGNPEHVDVYDCINESGIMESDRLTSAPSLIPQSLTLSLFAIHV